MLNKNSQKGFTLLELAIVLVIIGIILGAILKGQELINNAKAKRLLNDMKGLASMQYTFYDRYGRFAGDCDNNGDIDFDYLAADVNSFDNAAGSITSPSFCYDPTNPAASNDPDTQWFELQKANLVPNVAHNRDLVKHSFSGALYSAKYAVITPSYRAYNAVVATQVPCYAAKVIDNSIDNGIDAGKGSIREYTGTSLSTAAAWSCENEDDFVTVVYFFDRRP